MTLRLQILQSHLYNKKNLKKHRSIWMFLNGRTKKNRPREVRTQIARSVWDRRLSPNPRALALYLEFVPARGTAPEIFEEC